MYLYWDHSVGTSLAKGRKRIRQQKMTYKGARAVKKFMPLTQMFLYIFFCSSIFILLFLLRFS